MSSEPTTIQLPSAPVIAITGGDGEPAHMFTDGYTGEDIPSDMTPMRKASIIARLRALADLLEGGES